MAQQNLEFAPNPDNLNEAMTKIQSNFNELYNRRVGSYLYLDSLGGQTYSNPGQPLRINNNGGAGITRYPAQGITDLYNTGTNLFDFSEANLGDILTITFNANVITSSPNQVCRFDIKVGIGSASETTIIMSQDTQFKNQATYALTGVVRLLLTDQLIIDNPAYIEFISDGNATVDLGGFFAEVTKYNIG